MADHGERRRTETFHSVDPDTAYAVSEFLPDGLITALAPNGLIVNVNGPGLRILGLPSSELVGRTLSEALPFVDGEGNPWWPQASPFTGLNIRSGFRERLLFLPNGHDVLVTARYLRSEHLGEARLALIGVRSGETRRRAEAEQSALISTIAHELRSPLTGVKGFSSTLLRRWDRFSDDQKRLMIETIEADADRVTRLITELLDVSRIDARRLRIHPRPVEVDSLFARHIERLTATGSSVLVTSEPCRRQVWGDPDRLEQMLGNVIDNSVRHAAGRIHLCAASATPDWLDLLIDDDGPGVPPDRRELAFRKFTHGRAPGSTGLGLYIVRGLAEAQGGSAVLEESPLGGARLRIRLPAVADGEALPGLGQPAGA